MTGWKELKNTLDILPFGMTKIELKLLQTLKRDGMLRLYNLAAKMQMTRSAIQNGIEVYLQKLNLIEVTQNGRRLTKDGEEIFK
jgi:Holliday junction resolvasome RuvABC ATP-dependent DNA helicase subunit